jgi:hypothetical protein
MVLLHPTNRLQAFLAERGYKLNHSHVSFEMETDYRLGEGKVIEDYSSRYSVVEADYRVAENTPSDADAFGSIRDCFVNHRSGNCFSVHRVNGGQQLTAPNVPTGTVDRVDILWVSRTEFVTVKLFDELEGAYKLTVSMKRGGGELALYSYSIFQFNIDGEVMIGPPPVMPPRFLSHILAPILDKVSSINICSYPHATPPVDSTLALIPTTDHDLTQDVTICFSWPQSGLLSALISFPFHPKVCLSFWTNLYEAAVTSQVHDCLRDLKHLQHLEIPSCLLDFECTGVPFTANPAFKSLTLPTRKKESSDDSLYEDMVRFFTGTVGGGRFRWSSTMLNGMVHNTNLKCLNIVFTGDGMNRRQETMGHLTKGLASRSSHGHAMSRLSINEKVDSNRLWDSLFSPALVVNWLKQQQQKVALQTGPWNHRLSGMAIRAINRGNGYRSATNLIPYDLAPSSASAIFHLVITQHDESKNAGFPGAMPANWINRLLPKRQKH